MYIVELKKKEASSARRIKMAFWFLLFVVGFIIVRRVIFPGFYRWA